MGFAEHVLDDDQLRAIGKVVLAATGAEFAISILVSGRVREADMFKLMETTGAARRALKEAVSQHPDLAHLHSVAEERFARRNRLVHDLAMDQFVETEDGPVTTPVLLRFRHGADEPWQSRPAPSAQEIEALATELGEIVTMCNSLVGFGPE
ncbi:MULTISPECIES: hypothetical protein [unclassified Nocardioides]|uniref:hypothetical protein n=1 Tax=unclassified Nocardioides TaxID=2615069 RepID=UPI00105519FC|nr:MULTISPECIES: hypothetical protein [unclassified Nocardioides]